MPRYRHESGETVVTVANSFEDLRIGSLAASGKGGWIAVAEPQPEQPATASRKAG